jgi:KDO2-lipid IV(A) lauroyltransferase
MGKPRNNVMDYIACQLARVGEMFIRMIPVPHLYAAAGWLGDMLFRFDRKHRKRAVEHVRRSFPDWPEARVLAVAQRSLRHLVYLGLEMMLTTRKITRFTWRRHIRFGDNMPEALRLLLTNPRGLVLLTGHYGNWEIVGYTLATLGFPTVAVARRLNNPYMNEHILGIRERTGMKIVDKSGATEAVQDVLARRGVVGFIADQDAGRKGAFVDFFGRKASTFKIIALMAMEYNVPIVVGYGRRLGPPFVFEIGAARIIQPSEWAGRDNPVLWITQEYTTALERVIRQAPDQYLWAHRRWKHRPKGEEQPADGIA